MRNSRFFILGLLFVAALSTQSSYAQDYTRWGLPDGAKARLGKGGITGNVAYSPDGRRLAVATNIGIWLYDAGTYAEVNLIARHTRLVYSVAFSHDSSMLAVGYYDTLRLWDAGNGKHLRTLEGHVGGVDCVAFSPMASRLPVELGTIQFVCGTPARGEACTPSPGTKIGSSPWRFPPDGFTLASGASDGSLRVWDVRTGEAIQTLQDYPGRRSFVVAFSPDGLTLAGGRLPSTASASSPPGRIELWDTGTWEHVRTLEGHTATVGWVAFSPDGDMLASAGGWYDDTVRLWDTRTWKQTHTLAGHNRGVDSVAFSPDGFTLASAGDDDTVRLWDTRTGEHLHTLEGHADYPLSLAFSPGGPDACYCT